MTEDGAVFGGQNNLHEALENAYALYKPKMISIFTSCMPEIIGDDLTAFIKNARQRVHPQDTLLPYANTPSFNGSHIHGYDAMLLSILQTLTEGKQIEGRCTGKLNLIAGFDCNTGNYREYKRILKEIGIPYTFLADISDVFDSPCDGTYQIYPGGTKLEDAADSINGKATMTIGPYATPKTFTWIKDNYSGKHVSMPPFGIEKTDAFIMKLADLFGKPVPESPKAERGRAVDAMTDAHQHARQEIRRPRPVTCSATYPSVEMGQDRTRLCSKGTKKGEGIQALLDTSPYGQGRQIYINRTLAPEKPGATDPVDAIIGDTGKFITRDAKIPCSASASRSSTGSTCTAFR
jgi:nitrogenase molybdenum-iron protein beta chain